MRRFVSASATATAPDTIQHAASPPRTDSGAAIPKFTRPMPSTEDIPRIAAPIFRAWRRWLARRAGPLLWARAEANNPFDFFSADPVAEIPLRDVLSFVDATGKGYIMDIKSAVSLAEHAAANGETPVNPFNRAALPPSFHRRIALHAAKPKSRKGTVAAKPVGWEGLKATTEVQSFSLAVTDLFRTIEDLGYYTDPSWFMDLTPVGLQRLYIELADIWNHRATLSAADRARIVPAAVGRVFPMSVQAALIMQQKALRPLLLGTCQKLVSAAPNRSDKQLGVMYVLGALATVSAGAATAYPWLVEMFALGGVTRVVNGQLIILHPSVLAY